MSDIFSGIFGGATESGHNQSQGSTTNQAFPQLSSALGGQLKNSGAASDQIANMLGLNGPAGQQTGFDNWRNSTGYQFGLDQGVQGIVGNQATQGLLNSGSTAKAIDTFGQNYANTQYQNYLNPLEALLSTGNSAAGVLSSAGNVSQNTSSGDTSAFKTNGAGGFLGSLLTK